MEPLIALAILASFIWSRAASWPAFWDALTEPGVTASGAYTRGAVAAWHALLGAAIASLFPPYWWAAFVIVAVYWWKEDRDIAAGGKIADSIEDAIFVYLGALYGPWWWPLVILGATVAVALAQIGKQA